MKLDKNSHTPLYIQLRDIITNQIQSGLLKPSDFIPTEAELCETYNLSRYPVRQALSELVEMGYLERIRGRGTIVSKVIPNLIPSNNSKKLGLILTSLACEFDLSILRGFENEARKCGFLTTISSSDNKVDEELLQMTKMIDDNINSIFVFPCDESQIPAQINKLKEMNITLGLIDRNCGLEDLDYVGSDNFGGGYCATRHLAEQGFGNIVFIRTMQDVSSVNERISGYEQAISDFGLTSNPNVCTEEDIQHYNKYRESFFVDKLKDQLAHLKNYLPLGIVAANDAIAIYCLTLFTEHGFTIGKDVGIIGFDDITPSQYTSPPLSTIAQNGYLLGQSAAKILIKKSKGNRQKHKSIIPTQLIVRQSCGESKQ